jgi:cell wall-associated NlpC family hydrolase
MGEVIPDWAANYIGLPFREHGRDHNGTDCWGLVTLIGLAYDGGIDEVSPDLVEAVAED